MAKGPLSDRDGEYAIITGPSLRRGLWSLDEHFDRDKFKSIIDDLAYSPGDRDRDKPNPSRIVLQNKNMLSKADVEADAVSAALQDVKQKTAHNPELQAQVATLSDKFSEVRARSQNTYTILIDSKENVSDSAMSDVAALAQENKQVEAGLKELCENISKNFGSELETISVWSQRQRAFGITLFIVVMICAAGAATITERGITKPLQELADRIEEIAQGDGDLTRRLKITSKDEVGKVSSSFNLLMEKLQQVMLHVASNAEKLASATSELSVSASDLAQRSDMQQSVATLLVFTNQGRQICEEEPTTELFSQCSRGERIRTSARRAPRFRSDLLHH